MLKKVAEIKVKRDGHDKEIIEALTKAGFVVVIEVQNTLDKYYIISKEVTL